MRQDAITGIGISDWTGNGKTRNCKTINCKTGWEDWQDWQDKKQLLWGPALAAALLGEGAQLLSLRVLHPAVRPTLRSQGWQDELHNIRDCNRKTGWEDWQDRQDKTATA